MSNNFEEERVTWLINVINVLSFIIGVQNLNMNNKQVEELEEHLNKQDNGYLREIIKQNEEILNLLKEKKND